MKTNLVEELNVYIDDDTGDEYVYDGSKLVKIKVGTKTIGSRGSEDIQAREEEERNKEAAEGGVLETKDELEARIKRLEDALNDEELAQEITKETNAIKNKNEIRKELERSERELKQFRNDPIVQFEGSLNHFLRKQMKLDQEQTYNRLNKRYEGTGLIRKGIRKFESPEIPSVNVYFDRSGSWDEEKTRVGRQALATLDKYVRTGKLKVNIKYFNTRVFTNYTEKGEGGTWGSPILADVLGTRPDNVIVMTDSDITDCRETVTVPGVVWLLFKDGVSENLRSHLKGKMASESYEI